MLFRLFDIHKKFKMNVLINGQQKNIDNNLTVEQLVIDLGYKEKRFALEINGEVIPKSEYSNKIIFENDRLEIISAVGGG